LLVTAVPVKAVVGVQRYQVPVPKVVRVVEVAGLTHPATKVFEVPVRAIREIMVARGRVDPLPVPPPARVKASVLFQLSTALGVIPGGERGDVAAREHLAQHSGGGVLSLLGRYPLWDDPEHTAM
jgi:hypothetical protein